MRTILVLILALAFVATGCASDGSGDTAPAPTPDAVDSITPDVLRGHLDALQAIADDAGGTRASGTPGYAASVRYVEETLRELGLRPREDRFPLDTWRELAQPELAAAGVPVDDVVTMQYSPTGTATGALVPVDVDDPPTPSETSTSGCERGDFGRFPRGAVALLQRGSCFIFDKARNAQQAGAAAVVLMNGGTPGNTDAVQATLAGPGIRIPVVGISFEDGVALAAGRPEVAVRTRAETRRTRGTNVLAELPGTGDGVVLLGAHLDSVPAGPGINDNGSGVAALLATAAALRDAHPEKTIRFAFWDAEELGLRGSTAYVARLSDDERDELDAVVNVDMVGSPNGGAFVPDAPAGSEDVAEAFDDALAALGVPSAPSDLDLARTDLLPFADAGVPVGGVFSGANGAMRPDEADRFGGRAGAPYDPCYHQACDRADSVDVELATTLARAIALATRSLAGA